MNSYSTSLPKASLRFFVSMGIIAIAFIIMSLPLFVKAATLSRELEIGMSGSDVTALQTYLAETPYYPEAKVTGYFGVLTKAAVARFQAANDLPSVGRVGPMTLPVINAKMSGLTGGMTITSNDPYAPTISNVNVSKGKTNATVTWMTNEPARGTVYYSTSPLTMTEGPTTLNVISGSAASTDNSLVTNQNISITGLTNDTTYYYMVYVKDAAGNVSVTVPATFRTNP